ncbi:MAG: helix-turn-helix domain-containing protein [Rariglobus sp.]|nr:helix-turn-helix domain-containing protein [Rariglobus sp.]
MNTVSFGFHGGAGRQQPMVAAEQHNEVELNFIERGGIVLRRGIETVTLRAGDGVVYWAAVPHQVLEVEPRTRLTWIVIPLSWFLGWGLEPSFTRRLLEGGLLPVSPSCGNGGGGNNGENQTVFSFAGWSRDFASGSASLKAIVRLELEAFFRRLAEVWSAREKNTASKKRSGQKEKPKAAGIPVPVASPVPSITAEHQCRHVERMVRYITGHFQEEITVAMIAGSAKLNSEYAMRLFRRRWGMTLWRFLMRQRISEARRLLLLSDMPLAEVALASGFQSLSRFYEAFKTECGCSPGTYRRQQLHSMKPVS